MARSYIDLRDFGIELGADGEWDTAPLEQATGRLRAALEELAKAWEAAPPMARRSWGTVTITLHTLPMATPKEQAGALPCCAQCWGRTRCVEGLWEEGLQDVVELGFLPEECPVRP
jgi:hypothetical protein